MKQEFVTKVENALFLVPPPCRDCQIDDFTNKLIEFHQHVGQIKMCEVVPHLLPIGRCTNQH